MKKKCNNCEFIEEVGDKFFICTNKKSRHYYLSDSAAPLPSWLLANPNKKQRYRSIDPEWVACLFYRRTSPLTKLADRINSICG